MVVIACLLAFEADVVVDAVFAQKVTSSSFVIDLTIAASEVDSFV